MTMTGFRSIMLKLQSESLYIPMFVFLNVYKDVKYVDSALEELFLALFMKEWKEKGTDIFTGFYEVLN